MINRIRITSLILFLMTVLWVILMVISTSSTETDWEPGEFVKWAAQPNLAYRLNYINVSLLTLGVVFFFGLLYNRLRKTSEVAALAGILFVPIYGVMNLICYSLQISFVPSLAQSAVDHPDLLWGAAQYIQANPASAVGFINGLAYAVLGIPSLIYGFLLMREAKKFSGLTLMLSGVLCLLGMVGMMLNHKFLSMGIMAGGFLFLISLGCMWVEFRERIN